MSTPLAVRIRPGSLSEMVGQQHLLGEGALLRRIAQGGNIPNLIFYGPSGVGKTTAARIIAAAAGKKLEKLNGTTASTGDIKAIIAGLDGFDALGGVILYLDEIQYLNKKQQQTLLEFIEDGSITLIASTTENPYFYVYGAILSRSTVFEFKPVPAGERPLPYKGTVAVSLAVLHKAVGVGTADMLKVVGTLRQGTEVTVTGRNGPFAQLKNGLWMKESFLEA